MTTQIAILAFFCLVPGMALLLEGYFSSPTAQILPFATVALSITGWIMWRKQLLAGGIALIFVLALLRIKITFSSLGLRISDVGPSFWAVGGALGLVFMGFLRSTKPQVQIHHTHLLFAGFIVWGVVLIPFQPGPRPMISLLTAALLFWPLVISVTVFTLRQYGLSQSIGSRMLVAVVAGHLLIAVTQIINFGTLGLSFLGETEGGPVSTISFLGQTLPTGPYISGLTYRGPMTVLLTLTIPVMIALAWQTHRRRGQITYMVLAAVAIVVLLLTRWDAGYIGTLTALAVFSAGVVSMRYNRIDSFVAGGVVMNIAALVIGIYFLLSKSVESILNPNNTIYGTQYLSVKQWIGGIVGLSVPIFSTANLETRLQQYVLGLDLLLQYPFTGVGLTNFYYMSDEMGLDQAYLMHNILGQVFVGTGLIGGSLYIMALLVAVRSGINKIMNSEKQVLSLALLAGLVGAHVQMMFNPQLIKFVSINGIWITISLLLMQKQMSS